MSENKCPVCQKGKMMFKDNHACECSQCRFQCHRGHLDSIAAAMDLAKDASEWNEESGATNGNYGRLAKANKRVLEVFNG